MGIAVHRFTVQHPNEIIHRAEIMVSGAKYEVSSTCPEALEEQIEETLQRLGERYMLLAPPPEPVELPDDSAERARLREEGRVERDEGLSEHKKLEVTENGVTFLRHGEPQEEVTTR